MCRVYLFSLPLLFVCGCLAVELQTVIKLLYKEATISRGLNLYAVFTHSEKKKYKTQGNYLSAIFNMVKITLHKRCTVMKNFNANAAHTQTTNGAMNALFLTFFNHSLFIHTYIRRTQKPSRDVERANNSQLWQENSSSEARQGEAKVAQAPLLPWFSSPSYYSSGAKKS